MVPGPLLAREPTVDKSEINEIIACLPRCRTRFAYFKNRYALLSLARHYGTPAPVRRVKASGHARLLKVPEVRDCIAASGDGIVRADDLLLAWHEPHVNFVLTLASWGGESRRWQQTSRPGHNLVLQVNFSNQHRCAFQRLVDTDTFGETFNFYGHPACRRTVGVYRDTMSWVRMDIDLAGGQALIEEIQSDWMRRVGWVRQRMLRRLAVMKRHPARFARGARKKLAAFLEYAELLEAGYGALWLEASLSAALEFLFGEIGIETVYFHSWETGNRLKRISGAAPRSIYTRLPKAFCMTPTEAAPSMLTETAYSRRELARTPRPRWFVLEAMRAHGAEFRHDRT